MIFFRFWDQQNPIFCRQFCFFRSAENGIFFQVRSDRFLNLETAKVCYNEWFDWSNISYHPMTSFITVLTTIVSGFISTCGNVFLCSCRPWFWYQDISKRIKECLEMGMVGKKSWGRINWPIYTEDEDKGPCLLWTLQ